MTTALSTAPVAVVTGGARGIGLGIARWFLARGYRVALLDIDADTLARTEAELNDTAHVLALVCDVSKPVTRWPRLTRSRLTRPSPQPTSRVRRPGEGRSSKNASEYFQ